MINTCRLSGLAILAMAAMVVVAVPPRTFAEQPVPLNQLVFVSDVDTSGDGAFEGCGAVDVIDARSGRAISYGSFMEMPARLTSNLDGSLVLAGTGNGVLNNMMIGLRQVSAAPQRWRSFFPNYPPQPGGGAWIAPDGEQLLLPNRFGTELVKYRLSEIRGDAFGPSHERCTTRAWVADVTFSRDSSTAHVVDVDGTLQTIDIASMTAVGAPVSFTPMSVPRLRRMGTTNAALSPDGGFLVVNTGNDNVIVIDLVARSAQLLETPGIVHTWDVAFNYAMPSQTYLAVGGRDVVGVYQFSGTSPLVKIGTMAIPAQPVRDTQEGFGFYRYGVIAWTGLGDGVIASIGGGFQEFRILDFRPLAEKPLTLRLDFDSCTSRNALAFPGGIDILTLNDRLPPPTATPSPTSMPTDTSTPTNTPAATYTTTPAPPSSTATSSPTLRASATVTPHPSSTATPKATRTAVPGEVYLPLVLVERCDPQHKRADVALVIDTSSSMAGKKLEDAKAAAAMFVGQMDLAPGRDQVAVVRYDTQAELVCQLTNARAVIDAAIRNLNSRIGTHIDAGLRLALAELQSPRHLDRNMSVMILLTDGIQTGTPGEELRAAAEVHAAGVRLYTIGLGADADATALQQMAGESSRYRFAPDSADLARIYAEIAGDILCPAAAGGFWPG